MFEGLSIGYSHLLGVKILKPFTNTHLYNDVQSEFDVNAKIPEPEQKQYLDTAAN